MTVAASPLRAAARGHPDKPAVILAGTGERTTYALLEERSRRLAAALARRGLGRGDHVAILMENSPASLEVAWAAQRSGLYYTPVNAHLRPAEVDHIVADSGAAALLASASLGEVALRLAPTASLTTRIAVDGDIPGFDSYDDVLAGVDADVDIDETEGAPMFYSSGTTGRPKGVLHALPPRGRPSAISLAARGSGLYSVGPDTVHLTPAPLYHAAPLVRSMTVHRAGGTVVLMRRFDAVEALRAIEEHRVSQAQFVPTMFVRLLRLDDATRAAFDVAGRW